MEWNTLDPSRQIVLVGILASCTRAEIDFAISRSFSPRVGLLDLVSSYPRLARDEAFRRQMTDLVRQAVEKERLASFVAKLRQQKLGSVTFRNLADLVQVGASKVSISGKPGFEFQKAANQFGVVYFECLLQRLAEIKEATCRIVLPDRQNEKSAQSLGTGILVGDDLVLTNYHVVSGFIDTDGKVNAPPSTLSCQFEYLSAKGDGVSVPVAADENWVVGLSTIDAGAIAAGKNPASKTHLDYALIRLARPAPPVAGKLRDFETPSSANAFIDGLPVLVTHYPGQDPLSASFGKTVMTQANGLSLRYDADVTKGSSGSGVYLLPACSLVSLHQGTAPDAGYNQGIPIGRILEDWRRKARG